MIKLQVFDEAARQPVPLLERIEALRQALSGAYDCVAEHGKHGLASLDNVKRLVEDVDLALKTHSDSFVVSGDEDFRVSIGTVCGRAIAFVYTGTEGDEEQDPVFSFDGTEGNNQDLVFQGGMSGVSALENKT